jgi:8-oxo-dGTP pyrophosphatase MutT (NUDIX family)
MPDASEEPWEEVAARELEEETGYRAGALFYLGGSTRRRVSPTR